MLYRLFVLFTLLLAPGNAEFRFRNIADSRPGTPFSGFGCCPVINNNGSVAFKAYSKNGQESIQIYSNGALRTAVDGTQFPGLYQDAINDNESIVFRVPIGQNWAYYLLRNGHQPQLITQGLRLDPLGINNSDKVVLNFYDRIVTFSGGQFTTVVDSSEFPGALLYGQEINDQGRIAFEVAGQGIYTKLAGSLTSIYTQFVVSPQPSLNSLGQVAFLANTEVRIGSGGSTTTFASTFAGYGGFFAPNLNSSGTVAFYSAAHVGNYFTPGIFAGPNPMDDRVIADEDPLFDSVLAGLGQVPIGYRYQNDRGEIAFSYQLENGVKGVAVATRYTGPPCQFTIQPTVFNIGGQGGTGTVTVTQNSGNNCPWQPTTVPSWVTFTSGGQGGEGSGSVQFTVAPNTETTARIASFVIRGTIITISQPGGSPCSLSVSPTSFNIPGTGGGGTITVTQTAGSGCQWQSQNIPSWVSINGASSGTGSGTITYNVSANNTGSTRSGTATIAGTSVTFTQPAAPSCAFTYSATSFQPTSQGGSGTLTITQTSGQSCPWSITGIPSWVTFTSPTSGTGSATITFTFAANTSTTQRTGSFTIAGQVITITQAALSPCSVTVSFDNTAIPPSGGSFTLVITASAPSCAWSIQNLPAWITIGGGSASGTGSTTLTLLISVNASVQRSVNLTIGGQTIVIVQAQASCSYSVSQTHFAIDEFGTSGTINITAPAGCPWSIQNTNAWIVFTSGSGGGSGSGSVSYQIAANTGAVRSGTLTIAGITLSFTQPSSSCTVTYTASTTNLTIAGGTITLQITASTPNCQWAIPTLPSWIVLPSGQTGSGAGNASVTLIVAANGGAARFFSLTIGTVTISIQQAGATVSPQTGANRFVPVRPCRLMETRQQYNFEGRTGAFGPPSLTGGETRTLRPSLSNLCTIPTNARAYVLNVTVIPNGTGVDYISLWPAGSPRPDAWTVRSPDAQTVANSAIVKAGNDGAFSVFASNGTDLIIDISGYFTDDASVSNLVFYPLTPCRVIETRAAYRPTAGPFGPPSMLTRETRTFRIPANPHCPVPTGAAAYAVTITVVPPAVLPFLTAWPSDGPQPNVSSINSFNGRILANSVIVPASPDGSINLYAFERTDVIVDITGYFAPDDGVKGLYYFPLSPCRVSNTSDAGFGSGPIFADTTTQSVPISGGRCSGIPQSAKAFAMNAVVMPGGSPMPFLTVWPTGQPQPNASVINAFEGQVVSSGFIVPSGNSGSIDVYAYRSTHVAMEVSGYFDR